MWHPAELCFVENTLGWKPHFPSWIESSVAQAACAAVSEILLCPSVLSTHTAVLTITATSSPTLGYSHKAQSSSSPTKADCCN